MASSHRRADDGLFERSSNSGDTVCRKGRCGAGGCATLRYWGFDRDPLGGPLSGDWQRRGQVGQRSEPFAAQKAEDWLLALVRQGPDLTLEGIQSRLLDERQRKAGTSPLWRVVY